MKTFLNLALTLCLCITSFAQNNKIDFKSTQHNRESNGEPSIISMFRNDRQENIILKKESIKGPGGWRYFLEVRDKNLKKIKVEDISSKLDADNYIIEDIFKFDDQIIVFNSKLEKAQKREIFYYQSFDLNNYSISSRKKLYEITFEKKRKRPSLVYAQSENEEYLLVKIIPPINKKEVGTPKFIMLNSKLEKLWEREIKNEVSEEAEKRIFGRGYSYNLMNYEPYLVSNYGEIFTVSAGKLVKITEEDKEEIKINFEDFDLYGLKLGIDPYGDPMVSGYYSEKDTRGIKGVFFIKFDPENMEEISHQKTIFTKEMIQLGMSAKEKNKATKKAARKDYEIGADDLSIDDIVFDNNGNMYLIGSQFRVVVRSYTDSNGNIRDSYTYYYEDIFVSKFNELGEHIFDVKIPKIQISGSPLLDPYNYCVKDGKIAFFFIDHYENKNADFKNKPVTRVTKYKDCYITGILINEEGKCTRDNFYDFNAHGKKKFRVFNYLTLDESAIIFGYTGKKTWEFLIGTIQ